MYHILNILQILYLTKIYVTPHFAVMTNLVKSDSRSKRLTFFNTSFSFLLQLTLIKINKIRRFIHIHYISTNHIYKYSPILHIINILIDASSFTITILFFSYYSSQLSTLDTDRSIQFYYIKDKWEE